MTNPVCIVDDDAAICDAIAALVRSEGLNVETFASAQEYLGRDSASSPACLVLDVELPGLSGLELQRELTRAGIQVPIIFLTAHATVPMSVEAMKAGATEFFTKPLDADRLLAAILRAVETDDAHRRVASQGVSARVKEGHERSKDAGEGIIGTSSVFRSLLSQVRTVAQTDATVLIRGETGTGKELIARAIHESSARRNGPFVKINCAAIPFGLLESELMGHEKGAFTGAVARRIGRFELAQDGTLFLDEIGELPLDLQPKILRLLQEREFERVGGSKTLQCNARLIAATHRDLDTMIEQKTFRQDLFYRLSVFPIETPPLRARRQDIPGLVRHFVEVFSTRMKRPMPHIPPKVIEALMQHDWPGNIRELQNVLERAVIVTKGHELELHAFHRSTPRSSDTRASTLAAVDRAHILRVLDATNWVVAGPDGAAARLGMKRTTLLGRMKKLGIYRSTTAGSAPASAASA
ncbi:Transcriptional regulatory protein zraR [Labilithrix luteola]|uniref:Transcriptional regulatory protein zraR n=1 Tax=Labilithrix luteola TaxID=1391654 RepID=A0A0K1PPH9_9BACT|nr:sigma-54 dependent transcriptional regulator [Labilithrix luteola]AKU95024.1 Transcriptional regulatory protein zraR [Labilithrix luteola]